MPVSTKHSENPMTIKSFLRYNSRHSIFFPRGFRDRVLPQLDPIISGSHGKGEKRTWRLNEPGWAYRLRRALFSNAGAQRCGRRSTDGNDLPDTWRLGPDGNRTCSYCGSLHAEDLMTICRKVLVDDRYVLEGTTKSYKIYVRQPGVQNASQGAIKFYMAHAPENPTPADQKLYGDAMRISNERFAALHPPRNLDSIPAA